MSTAEILAAARTEKKDAEAASQEKTGTPEAKPSKMSTSDILAAARGQGAPADDSATEAATEPQAEETVDDTEAAVGEAELPEATAPAATAGTGELPTNTAEILDYCRRVDASG